MTDPRGTMRLTALAATVGLVLALAAAPAPAQGLSWSPQLFGTATWSYASQWANGLVWGTNGDWRLPTVAEVQSAIQGGTFPLMNDGLGSWLVWTSETRGTKAWAVRVTVDASGRAIPSQSGQAQLILKTSFVDAFAVRP